MTTDNPVMGHKHGSENWRMIKKAEELGWDQKKFDAYMSQTKHWQIEDGASNSSHRFEMSKNDPRSSRRMSRIESDMKKFDKSYKGQCSG